MALTVGGAETKESKNLSADKTYKVGVRAYKLDKESKGAKYYSAESKSPAPGVYLPKYTPLNMTLTVNNAACAKDENGVYHAYVDGKGDVLTVSSNATKGVSYKVTRMDTDDEIVAENDGTYKIPEFEGSLMFKIDGIQDIDGSQAKDVTSVFLLVSVDKTAPVLTLSAPIFYADPDSGKYTRRTRAVRLSTKMTMCLSTSTPRTTAALRFPARLRKARTPRFYPSMQRTVRRTHLPRRLR